MKTLVTTIIFAYNHEHYIKRTIESVLNQKTRFETNIIICDDCSTDKTSLIIEEYSKRFPDKIIPIINKQNIGLNETFRRSIQVVQSKYICLLGGDDYWIDDKKLEKQVSILEENPDVSYVHTGLKRFKEETSSFDIELTTWLWNMPQNRHERICDIFNNKFHYPSASTSCFRTEIMIEGLKKYSYLLDHVVGEGTIINVSMCLLGEKYFFIPDITTVYTIRVKSLSHHTSVRDELKYKIGYLHLKLLACKELKFNFILVDKVVNYALKELVYFAIKNNAIDILKDEINKTIKDSTFLKRSDKIMANTLTLYQYYLQQKMIGCMNRIRKYAKHLISCQKS